MGVGTEGSVWGAPEETQPVTQEETGKTRWHVGQNGAEASQTTLRCWNSVLKVRESLNQKEVR